MSSFQPKHAKKKKISTHTKWIWRDKTATTSASDFLSSQEKFIIWKFPKALGPMLRYSQDSSVILLHFYQFSSVAQSCPTLWDPMNRSTPGFPVHYHLPEFTQRLMSIESVMPSSHLILCRPVLLLPLIPPSIKVFSNESTLRMRRPKYWSFRFSIIPSKKIPRLISFRMDWLTSNLMILFIYLFFNLLRLGLWPRMCSILEKVPCVPEKKVKFIVLGLSVL